MLNTEEVFDAMESRLQVVGARSNFYGFDPTIIITIITILLPIIVKCLTKPDAKMLRNPGVLARVRLNAALWREIPQLTLLQRHQIIRDLVEVANESKDEELVVFVQGACDEC